METLLVIDDEPGLPHDLLRTLDRPGLALLTATSAREGLEAARSHRPDVVVLDLGLPDADGLELFRRVRALDPAAAVLVVTDTLTTDSAIEAIKLGAFDYLTKPLEPSSLRPLIDRALRVVRLVRQVGPPDDGTPAPGPAAPEALIGSGPSMREVYKAIGRVAPTDVTVLIRGESGTGKELVARAIHQHSRRAAGPFRAINCAAIPEGLLESELFGHEQGAFTGADRSRDGRFAQARGGTLLLDEIGDLAPMAQAKVLRVLQEGTFERVGGSQTIRADVRLIAATHRDLRSLSHEGRFREDLFYRLGVFAIHLPPLRERLDDLPLLVDHFLRRDRRELGKDVHRVDPATLDALRGYPWPGNIRELQSVLKQAVLRCHGPTLTPDFLPPLPGQGACDPAPTPPAGWDRFIASRLAAGSTDIYAEVQAMMEREVFTRVLRHTCGNQVQAARMLGITRGTLRIKLRALGLSAESPRRAAADPSP